MANAQHIRFQPMKANAISHNHRLKIPSYVASEKSEFNTVYIQTSKRNLTDYTKAVKADYESHHGQKYQAKMSPIWEGLFLVNPETKDEQIRKAIELIERETGLKIVDAVRHRDEGHFEGEEWIPNEHVHVIAERYDFDTHRHVTLDVKQIRSLRMKVAEALGIAYTQTRSGEKPKKNVTHQKFREEAQRAQIEKIEYDFRETQKRISALLEVDAEQKKQLHRLNTEINKIKTDEAIKERKIAELEAKLKEVEAKFEAEKIAATELAKSVDLLEHTDEKKYTAKSLIPHIKKKFEEKIANLEAENKALKAEVEEKTKDLERMDILYGQLEGAAEAEASNEELRELLKTHQPYQPKRTAYKTAKERARNAYLDRIRPAAKTDDDEPIFRTQDKIRDKIEADDEPIFGNRR
jgi:6-pyruvoyl-tetrahydropterin synthase